MIALLFSVVVATSDANAGAKLVQANGCTGCHGATFKGALGPALFGIEHRLSAAQIASRIKNPKAPMPNLGLSDEQVGDIVAYLSALDGGVGEATRPVVAFDPPNPGAEATIRVTFPGTPPKHVTASPIMQMGGESMHTDTLELKPTAGNPNVFTGHVKFSMGGPWTIEIHYDAKSMTVPLNVGGDI